MSKPTQAEQERREQEALESPVRADGIGEAPAVKALLSPEFEKMSNMDALQIAMMLQEIVRGQNSLLARYDETALQIARLRERQDKADQEIAERLEEQRKFVEEVLDRAEKLRRTGEDQDKLIAQGVAAYQQAKTQAVADITTKNLLFDQMIAKEDKVMVVSPGQLITVTEGGQPTPKIVPEEVRIRHRVWVLPPGVPTMVPKTVADFLSQRRQSQAETAKRADLLSKHMEANKLAKEWNEIEGSKTETMLAPT